MASISKFLQSTVQALITKTIDSGNIVSGCRLIIKTLEEHGLVYEARLPPKLLVCHWGNRDEYGVGAHDVHSLGDECIDIGWDEAACDPICCEIDERSRKFTAQLMHEAGGMLGSGDVALARFATLTCGHTNFFLRCVDEEIPHEGMQKICKDGRFSKAICASAEPAVFSSAVNGLQWRIIRAEAIQAWPELTDLFQSSGNTSAARGEHDLQMLRRVHNIIVKQQKGDGIDYEKLKKQALRSKPKCAAALPLRCDECMHACVPKMIQNTLYICMILLGYT